VVQASNEVVGSSTRGNDTVTIISEASSRKHTSWVVDVSVILSSLEITQWSGTGSRVRHDSLTSVDLVLLPKLTKDPPDALHESNVECLVVVVEIDPSPNPLDGMSPFSSISHDNLATGGIVLVNTHVQDILLALDVELFVNLVFDGKTVCVPTETALDVETVGPGVTSHDILLCQTKCDALLTLIVPRSKWP